MRTVIQNCDFIAWKKILIDNHCKTILGPVRILWASSRVVEQTSTKSRTIMWASSRVMEQDPHIEFLVVFFFFPERLVVLKHVTRWRVCCDPRWDGQPGWTTAGKTRMHSTSMRTASLVARISQHALLRGGTCPGGGVCLSGGCTCWGWCTCRGGWCTCPGVYLPGGCTCQGVGCTCQGCTCRGVYLPGGCTYWGSVPAHGVPAQGVYLPRYSSHPPCGQTHTCKNITS